MNEKWLGNAPQGLLFILSAPAGTGKSTVAAKLLESFPDALVKSCSYTTRPPRAGEGSGRDYTFITQTQFEAKIRAGDFLEYEQILGHYYGTGRSEVDAWLEKKKHVLLVIDVKGAAQLRANPHYQGRMVSIFMVPPSRESLRARMEKRGSETEQTLEERLTLADKELCYASEYDYVVTNRDLEVTYQVLRSIFIAEEHKRREIVCH